MEKIKVDLILRGKKGPFFVRKLDIDELMVFLTKRDEWTQAEQIKHMVQMCLVNQSGRNVFRPDQLKQLTAAIGGVELMMLADRASHYNDFKSMSVDVAAEQEAAVKN